MLLPPERPQNTLAESKRTYMFLGGTELVIDNPQMVRKESDGSVVITNKDNIIYNIPPGWIACISFPIEAE